VKLGIFTITTNIRFVGARQRIQPKIEALRRLLADVTVRGQCDNVILTFVDENPDYFRVIRKGRDDDIYQVNVGYDFAGNYPQEDDVLVIQLLEEKLERIIESGEGFAEKRQELLSTISDWTTEAIGA
jgi:hypothetical protein